MDLAGFSKNALTFSPIKAKNSIITNFDGSNIARNTSVLIFAKAAAPLSKNDGVKGKQYSRNNTFNFFLFTFSKV